ncbi:unnamed protein product [Closterium sp. NIES-53]
MERPGLCYLPRLTPSRSHFASSKLLPIHMDRASLTLTVDTTTRRQILHLHHPPRQRYHHPRQHQYHHPYLHQHHQHHLRHYPPQHQLQPACRTRGKIRLVYRWTRKGM